MKLYLYIDKCEGVQQNKSAVVHSRDYCKQEKAGMKMEHSLSFSDQISRYHIIILCSTFNFNKPGEKFLTTKIMYPIHMGKL